jgi:hypothetical protein
MGLAGGILSLSTVATTGTLVALLGARTLGGTVPAWAAVACAAAVAPIAAAAALQRGLHLWRGPPVVSFPSAEAVRCGGAEAEAIRVAARLRGTLGGAGHIYPGRVALHAVASAAAAAFGAFVLAAGVAAVPAWLVAVFAAGVGGVVLLPARPFYYREAMNGELLVTPANAPSLLAWSRSAPAAPVGAPRATGRGNSPSAAQIASKPADVPLQQEQ